MGGGGGGWRAADVGAVPTHILKLSTCSSGSAALPLTAGSHCQHKQKKHKVAARRGKRPAAWMSLAHGRHIITTHRDCIVWPVKAAIES